VRTWNRFRYAQREERLRRRKERRGMELMLTTSKYVVNLLVPKVQVTKIILHFFYIPDL
jgi:hypothetical protein